MICLVRQGFSAECGNEEEKFFPDSANAYDSLAESYSERGEKELAIVYYQKSLQLDPDNKNAVEKLRGLGAGR